MNIILGGGFVKRGWLTSVLLCYNENMNGKGFIAGIAASLIAALIVWYLQDQAKQQEAASPAGYIVSTPVSYVVEEEEVGSGLPFAL